MFGVILASWKEEESEIHVAEGMSLALALGLRCPWTLNEESLK